MFNHENWLKMYIAGLYTKVRAESLIRMHYDVWLQTLVFTLNFDVGFPVTRMCDKQIKKLNERLS